MPLPLLAAAKVGSQLAPLLWGLFHKKHKGPNMQAILDRYRREGVNSFLSPEDYAAAARTRAGVTAGAATAAETQRGKNQSQILQRGLGGPAAAALEAEAAATEATGREQGATAEAGQLYQTGTEKKNTLFGAELGVANNAWQRADQQDATFWNSMIDLAGATGQLWAPPNTTAPTTPTPPPSPRAPRPGPSDSAPAPQQSRTTYPTGPKRYTQRRASRPTVTQPGGF